MKLLSYGCLQAVDFSSRELFGVRLMSRGTPAGALAAGAERADASGLKAGENSMF